MNRRLYAAFATAALALGSAGSAAAETLADAVAAAYQTNPTLQQTRAQLRALDETYVQARAGLRPTLSATASVGYTRTDLGAGSGSGSSFVADGAGNLVPVASGGRFESNSGTGQLTASQPLYDGGRTVAAMDAAQASVFAGREGLRQTEATVLLSVIQAYADVRLEAQIVGIRQADVAVLQSQVAETSARFAVGQLTCTDAAQAQAQAAAARGLLSTAQATLAIGRAAYAAVVGQEPGDLAPEPDPPGLPADVDQAFDAGLAANPQLLQARFTEQASRARIAQARGANRPTVAATASLGYSGAVQPFDGRDYDRAITGAIAYTQPLATGGLNGSLIREAIETNASDRIGVDGARRRVVQDVAQAWSALLADRANIASDQEEVDAAQVAAAGTRAEYRLALRITLDVLTADTNLRAAQLALAQARHDTVVAQATLLAAMGRLDATALAAGVTPYDPAKHFQRVKTRGGVLWEGAVAALDRLGEAGQEGRMNRTMIPVDKSARADEP